jgi:hypothetical protein
METGAVWSAGQMTRAGDRSAAMVKKIRFTPAITAPHFSALPIARLSRGHNTLREG